MHTKELCKKHLKNRIHMSIIFKISLSSKILSSVAMLHGGKWGIVGHSRETGAKKNSYLGALLIFLISIFKPRYLCMRK